MTRAIHATYRDPLDVIWVEAARRLGLTVERSPDAFASTDGRGRLLIADDASMDADDCLAQMIFHEVCHWLIQGEDARRMVDWGLDNETDRDLTREYACLRLQAALLDEHGLREVLAPTTEHRVFYDALGADPFASGRDAASELARVGRRRAERAPWAPHLGEALAATRTVVAAVAPHAGATDAGGLLFARQRPVTRHASGALAHSDPARRCGTCAWFRPGAAGQCAAWACAATEQTRACVAHEPVPDCHACGACCREAYTSVEVEPGEPLLAARPDLIVLEDGRRHLPRASGRCVALRGGERPDGPFTCDVYALRPRACRELEAGGDNCLEARRAVGLSR